MKYKIVMFCIIFFLLLSAIGLIYTYKSIDYMKINIEEKNNKINILNNQINDIDNSNNEINSELEAIKEEKKEKIEEYNIWQDMKKRIDQEL